MDKSFLVRIKDDIYCGKCGELLYQSKNEISHHERIDHVRFVNRLPYELDDIKTYALSIKDGHLELSILQAEGNLSCFKGIVWKIIYTCSFYVNSNSYTETGTGTLMEWLEYLECDMLLDVWHHTDLNINEEADFITINKVFQGVAYVESIADFIKIYIDKGFRNNPIKLSDIRKIKTIKPDYNISFKNRNMESLYFCQLREEEIGEQVIMAACCMIGVISAGQFMIKSKANLYISKDFVYNPSGFDLATFLYTGSGEKVTYGRFRYDKFHSRYPELKLKEYIESGGRKYLDFLLAQNNNRLLELVGKSELGYLSNHLNKFTSINFDGKNVKDVFGLPIKVLRNINIEEITECLTDADMLAIKKAYSLQPAAFDNTISQATLCFIKANLGNTGNPIRIRKLDKKTFLEYVRYCNQLNEHEYNIFVDYSNMCVQTGLWPYKRFPDRKDIQLAHDVIMNHMNEMRRAVQTARSEEQNAQFQMALLQEDYTDLIELPHTYFFEQSNYTLLMPRTADDLVEESYQMRNCVRSYVGSVAMGRTFILFLRKKSSKSKSFITIEVTYNYRLSQVKGKGNSHPPDDVIDWVSKWAEAKGISYKDCYDLQDRRGYRIAV